MLDCGYTRTGDINAPVAIAFLAALSAAVS